MAARHDGTEGKTRFWPGIMLPAGLTALLLVAVWLFAATVETDQKNADAQALELERRARRDAADLVAEAGSAVTSLTQTRAAARQTRERNLRLEARGVLDAVYRLLTASLEQARKRAGARREVGPFPPGFEGVRSFLEIPPAEEGADPVLSALRAASPELSSLLPSGCSLAVVEDNSRELLSLGGGLPPAGALAAAVTRDFILDDGGTSRNWSLRVEMFSPNANPPPTAAEAAEHLSAGFAGHGLEGAAWRGWLISPDGGTAAAFPALPAAGGKADGIAPPYTDRPGEWVEIDERRLVWLERSGRLPDLEWRVAVAVSIPRPARPLEFREELWREPRWGGTLGALLLLSLAGWGWFAHGLFTARRKALASAASAASSGNGAGESKAVPPGSRQRLVRDERLTRAIPDVQGVIVADIGEDGEVHLQPPGQSAAASPRPMPSGSLYRLQGIHRGREGMRGSRVLDDARTPILRELARRVRPVVDAEQEKAASARRRAAQATATEKIASLKSASGWRKVE